MAYKKAAVNLLLIAIMSPRLWLAASGATGAGAFALLGGQTADRGQGQRPCGADHGVRQAVPSRCLPECIQYRALPGL
jgi:hypothetical protein